MPEAPKLLRDLENFFWDQNGALINVPNTGAVQALPANSARTKLIIQDNSTVAQGSNAIAYVAALTGPKAAFAQGIEILAGGNYIDDANNCFKGAVYLVAAAGANNDVTVREEFVVQGG